MMNETTNSGAIPTRPAWVMVEVFQCARCGHRDPAAAYRSTCTVLVQMPRGHKLCGGLMLRDGRK